MNIINKVLVNHQKKIINKKAIHVLTTLDANARFPSQPSRCRPVPNCKYIKAQLRDKLKELNIEKEHIIAFPDPQVKNLMFRWCFCQKIDYLQRTTSPRLLDEFVYAFDRMKREIFCSLLEDAFTADNIPEEIWKRACLNIGDGGLGYRSVHDVSFKKEDLIIVVPRAQRLYY